MVNPDASAVADSDAIVVEDMANLQVLHNHIVAVVDIQSVASDVGRRSHADDGLVGADGEARDQRDLALDLDNPGHSARHRRYQLVGRRDIDSVAALAANGLAEGIVFGVALDAPGSHVQVLLGECRAQADKAIEEESYVELHVDRKIRWIGAQRAN